MARYVEVMEDGEVRAPRVHQYREGLISLSECHWAMVNELFEEGVSVPSALLLCEPSNKTVSELNWLWLN